MRKRVGTLLFCIIFVIGLVSCKSKDIAEGTWELIKGYKGETEVTAEQLQKEGAGGITFTFKDGTVTIKSTATSEESEGTYTVKGNTIEITSGEQEESIKGTIANGELTIVNEESDLELVFERQ